jgi:23S rRNA (cytosine1962-C5)-methyltransferase
LTDSLTLVAEPEKDYELIDSGEGFKLERYGKIVVSRPDPQAIWPKTDSDAWRNADAVFGDTGRGRWKVKDGVADSWTINFDGLAFNIYLSAFKHTGIFPEHKPSWGWISDVISGEKRKISVLNLFGYTGGATLAAARAGADVTHLDGSKVAINWAKENAKNSGLGEKPIRWIVDDAMSFVKREIRRGNKYDGIIMDPPSYGHGPKGEMWQIEDDLLNILKLCREILSDEPLFFLLNGYAAGYSALGYANMMGEIFPFMKDKTEHGEIGIRETARNIILPSGIFARWHK